MLGAAFVQPVAGHTELSSYLIVRDTGHRWYVWKGSDDEGLVEIPEALAAWLRARPEIEDFPLPCFWFEPASLPLCDPSAAPTLH